MAPPITKARLGSQVPARSRKFSTLAGLAIPEITSPSPKTRPDRRPQTPCPEVQPEPSAVPSPTRSPAKAMPPRLSGTVCSTVPPRTVTASGARINPARKAHRQSRSFAAPGSAIAPCVMPAMPAMRPKSAITITALSPISTPPNSEAQGVNAVSIPISIRVLHFRGGACPVRRHRVYIKDV